ncbi:hypothetical protein GCM10011571_00640 [Marinithermofilum abyssi]|uniref:Uncharacterized protein n=1 Tax=Marinithermofilum abyssi TaxID=1571185 RepID=A0A8J2VFD2_9BACL|nr:hypothetical protein GCM10011571_00640 [Marinithermofilum abyssi]
MKAIGDLYLSTVHFGPMGNLSKAMLSVDTRAGSSEEHLGIAKDLRYNKGECALIHFRAGR